MAPANAGECDSERRPCSRTALFSPPGQVERSFLRCFPLSTGVLRGFRREKGCRTRVTARVTARFGQPAQAWPPSPRSPGVNAWHGVPPTVSPRTTRVRARARTGRIWRHSGEDGTESSDQHSTAHGERHRQAPTGGMLAPYRSCRADCTRLLVGLGAYGTTPTDSTGLSRRRHFSGGSPPAQSCTIRETSPRIFSEGS